jgi:hypothetical protein
MRAKNGQRPAAANSQGIGKEESIWVPQEPISMSSIPPEKD